MVVSSIHHNKIQVIYFVSVTTDDKIATTITDIGRLGQDLADAVVDGGKFAGKGDLTLSVGRYVGWSVCLSEARKVGWLIRRATLRRLVSTVMHAGRFISTLFSSSKNLLYKNIEAQIP